VRVVLSLKGINIAEDLREESTGPIREKEGWRIKYINKLYTYTTPMKQ
jgi:hypothetical protein